MIAEPVPLEAAWRWIEANAPQLEAEEVDLAAASGRVPASAPIAGADVPASACAAEDGYAVRAEETLGAAPYNPLPCAVVEVGDGPLPHGAAARVAAGEPLPPGADAVLPRDAIDPEAGSRIAVLAPVAEGDGVMIASSELRAGEPFWPVERQRQPLRPAAIGLLGAAGVWRVSVTRQPRTRILIAGAPVALGPMLRALVELDGGRVIGVDPLDRRQSSAEHLVAGVDVVLIAGGPADGPEMEVRGVAIEPGCQTCLGRANGTAIVLLPGLPAACLWAYELVAGRAIRCRGGRDPCLPYPSRCLRTTRKIVSTLGFTEAVPVRLDPDDRTAVLPSPGSRPPRLRIAAQADGFTLVPATSEGSAAGSVITVWLFEPAAARDAGRG
jgi:molybdopterin molybdotransferase